MNRHRARFSTLVLCLFWSLFAVAGEADASRYSASAELSLPKRQTSVDQRFVLVSGLQARPSARVDPSGRFGLSARMEAQPNGGVACGPVVDTIFDDGYE